MSPVKDTNVVELSSEYLKVFAESSFTCEKSIELTSAAPNNAYLI